MTACDSDITIACAVRDATLTIRCHLSNDVWEGGERANLGCTATLLDHDGVEQCTGTGAQSCDDATAATHC